MSHDNSCRIYHVFTHDYTRTYLLSGHTMALGSTQPLTEMSRLRLICDGTRAETKFCLSAKRTTPFKSAGASVQLTAGSRGVRISGSNPGYTMFRGSLKGTGYPLHSPLSPSLPYHASPCAITFQLDSNPG